MAGRPDLEDLELLVLVAQTESIGAAAARLGVSQPSVSRRIAALERRLRLRLFQRTPRGSRLTQPGRAVVGWAESLLRAADEFDRAVDSLQSVGEVTVRAAVSMTIAEHHAPGWLAVMRREMPQVTVALSVANSTDVAELVQQTAVDVGFLESPTVRPGLRRRRFGSDTLLVAVASDHPWARRRSVSLEQLGRERLLVREPGSGTRETLERSLGRHSLQLQVALEMASNTALKAAAVAGMGPLVLSELAVLDELASGRLVRVDVAELDLARPLSAVWRGDAQLSAAARMLLRTAMHTAVP